LVVVVAVIARVSIVHVAGLSLVVLTLVAAAVCGITLARDFAAVGCDAAGYKSQQKKGYK
jgi:hypothetical protein